MYRLIVSNHKGFSLLETLIAITVLGILASLGIPNLLTLINRTKVKEGFTIVQNTLQESQRQAIRRGQPCTVQLGKATGSTSNYYDRLRVSPVGCLVSVSNSSETIGTTTYQTVLLPDGVKVTTNMTPNPPSFTFSYQGHIASYSGLAASNEIATLVVFPIETSTDTPSTDSSQVRKCLMASSMLALFRSGNYSDAINSSISSTKCNPPVGSQ